MNFLNQSSIIGEVQLALCWLEFSHQILNSFNFPERLLKCQILFPIFQLYPSRVKSWLKYLQILLTWLTLCWNIAEKFCLFSSFVSNNSKSKLDLFEMFTISDSNNSTSTSWIFEHKYVFTNVKIINRNKEYLIIFLTFFIVSI